MFDNSTSKRKPAKRVVMVKYRNINSTKKQSNRPRTSTSACDGIPPPPYSASKSHQALPLPAAHRHSAGQLALPISQSAGIASPPCLPNRLIPKLTAAPRNLCSDLTRVTTAPLQAITDGVHQFQLDGGHNIRGDVAVCDLISSKFDAVITSIDGEAFSGDERELVIYQPPEPAIRGGWGLISRDVSKTANTAISSAVKSPKSTNYFAKADLYANSRLPPNLPTLNLYLPSYPLLCLAANYSQKVYTRPTGKEREAHIDADWRMGTKAMVMKSVSIDDMNTIVFAVRGSQTFMDWAVNLSSAPTSPIKFLDDNGNLCHSGFLAVARKMIKPVAARLRSLLEENPARSSFSLLMTGHSAGGAVASLLYMHMLAEYAQSELNILTGCFKRIHCITFGAPPVSLLPLSKPPKLRYKKSLFLSFINEGDPVPRADKAYVRSLLALYASPAPGASCLGSLLPVKTTTTFALLPGAHRKPQTVASVPPVWKVPPGTLSNAGRLVVLRTVHLRMEDDVMAEVTSDEELRSVVFGNPMMHMMRLYARRIEILATKAVTAKIWG